MGDGARAGRPFQIVIVLSVIWALQFETVGASGTRGAPVWIARLGLTDNDGHDGNATRDTCNMDGMAMAAARDALAAHRWLGAHITFLFQRSRTPARPTDAGRQPRMNNITGTGTSAIGRLPPGSFAGGSGQLPRPRLRLRSNCCALIGKEHVKL